MGVKWEQDAQGRWSQTGGESANEAGLAREVAALRHEQRWDPKLAARAVEESCAWAPEEVGEMLALQLHLRLGDVRKRYA